MNKKKPKLFKNKIQMIIYSILMIIILALFIVIGRHDFNENVSTEAELFHNIYTNVPKDNVYVMSNAVDVNTVVSSKNNSGIILFGFSTNKWTSYYAEYINEVAKKENISEILYYDFFKDRNEKNGTYEKIVESLSVYTTFNDVNHADIFAPTLVVVKNGEVIAFLDETAEREGKIDPETYWNQFKVSEFKSQLSDIFREYLK